MHSFTFQIHIHIHIFTSEVTCYFCYFCYRPTILLPLNPFLPFYLFTFFPFYPFTFKTASRRSRCYVATCLALRRDVAIATSGRSFGGIARGVKGIVIQPEIPGSALSNSSNIFLSYTGLLIFCPCVRQQYKM